MCDTGGTKKGPATKIFTKLKKDVVIETTTWLEEPQPTLKLEIWVDTKPHFELLISGYLKEVESEFSVQIPKGLKTLMIEYGTLDNLGLSWDDPNLLKYLI